MHNTTDNKDGHRCASYLGEEESSGEKVDEETSGVLYKVSQGSVGSVILPNVTIIINKANVGSLCLGVQDLEEL